MSATFVRLVLLCGCVAAALAKTPKIPSFQDVTEEAGVIQVAKSFKFGGPCVADIDNDGHYDLLLSYHSDERMQIFYGSASGVFTMANFSRNADIHGVTVAQRKATSRDRIFPVSLGGKNGELLRPPEIYMTSPSRAIRTITKNYGFGKKGGRGRVSVFMDLSMRTKQEMEQNEGGPDVLFINFLGRTTDSLKQFAYQNRRGNYRLRQIKGFEREREGRAEVTDIDGDGVMELISFREFRIYKLVSPFTFEDMTSSYVPVGPNLKGLSVAAICEFDFDNDGDFDLYVARTSPAIIANTDPTDADSKDITDILLRNDNGMYVDVTKSAGLPSRTRSMGVTSGDFNNDGYVDIMVSLYKERDLILLNRGDGTFETVRGLIPKPQGSVGDNAVAVDYNLDGRVDLVVGQGGQAEFKGTYHLLKNSLKLQRETNFLLVRVANAPGRGATSLHAVVTVLLGNQRLTRRVGSPGAQAGGGSYLDTVHFGLGSNREVDSVTVKWTNTVVETMTNVDANRKYLFGVI